MAFWAVLFACCAVPFTGLSLAIAAIVLDKGMDYPVLGWSPRKLQYFHEIIRREQNARVKFGYRALAAGFYLTGGVGLLSFWVMCLRLNQR